MNVFGRFKQLLENYIMNEFYMIASLLSNYILCEQYSFQFHAITSQTNIINQAKALTCFWKHGAFFFEE